MFTIPKPVGNKLIVFPLDTEEQVIGGVIIPGNVNAELESGRIVARSETLKDLFNVGETVLYPSSTGTAQIIDKKPHKWLDVNEVWGIADYTKPEDKQDSL
jgi:co-chaperonin GroES (HSP10)